MSLARDIGGELHSAFQTQDGVSIADGLLQIATALEHVARAIEVSGGPVVAPPEPAPDTDWIEMEDR